MDCYETVDWMGEALEGRLEPALRAGFEAHFAECGPCATYFDHLRAIRAATLAMPRETGTCPRREELLAEFRRAFGTRDH
jgi:anti-sigma factor RsiW